MSKKTEIPDMSYISTSRYVCDVLQEMRVCIRTLDLRTMRALIEEAQVLANRMEAALGSVKDIEKLHKDIHALKQTRKALLAECKALIKERDGESD